MMRKYYHKMQALKRRDIDYIMACYALDCQTLIEEIEADEKHHEPDNTPELCFE